MMTRTNIGEKQLLTKRADRMAEYDVPIQEQTEAQGGLFFFKQWGTWGSDGVKRSKHKNGKMLDGKILQAMPMV